MEAEGDRFRDLAIAEFIRRLASAEPVPGGGSASAIAASLAASLVAMVASLSEGRPKYAAHAALLAEKREAGLRLAERFLQLADDDAAAYAGFSAALKLPRENESDAAERAQAIHAAARLAAEVPLDCVEACLELVSAAESLAGRSNANAASDLNVAALLGEAAARGAAANVLVNLPSIGDPEVADQMNARVDELTHEIGRIADQTRAVVLSDTTREPLEVASSGSLTGSAAED